MTTLRRRRPRPLAVARRTADTSIAPGCVLNAWVRSGSRSVVCLLAGALWVALGTLSPVLAQAATTAGTGTFTNPIKARQGADPWMLYYQGEYYLATTTWSSHLSMREAPTLAGLATAHDVIIWMGDAPTRCCNMWAPEFHLLDGPDGLHWYLYYVAGQDVHDYNPTQRLHVLESEGTDPMGPYHFKADLMPERWALDPDILKLNGKLYLLGTFMERGQDLFIAPLRDPWTLSGPPVVLSRPSLLWERFGAPVEEGPEALQHDGKTFIVFSASGCWTPNYALGLLTYRGGDPLDPESWLKAPEPVFQSDNAIGVFAPGHNGFFTSPDGAQDWIVYHANSSPLGGCDNNRSTRAQPFAWRPDGTPDFGAPIRLGVPLEEPSGTVDDALP